jgi:hypothetical protein
MSNTDKAPDTSRARGSGARERPRSEAKAVEEQDLTAVRSETTLNGLPHEKRRLLTKLLAAIEPSADEGTAGVLASYAREVPEGAIAKVLESVTTQSPRNPAGYAVAALKREAGLEVPATLRAFVERTATEYEPHDLEAELRQRGATDDQLIPLMDLAANVCRQTR